MADFSFKAGSWAAATVVAAGAACWAGPAQAALIIDDTPADVSIIKSGGTFANAKIINFLDRAVAAEFANYDEFRVDVTLKTYGASGNLGLAWNSNVTGAWKYSGLGGSARTDFTAEGQSATLIFDYSENQAFQDAVAAWADGSGSGFEFFVDSTWPAYDATNVFEVTQIYLVPEPASLALLGMGGLVALRRRRA